MIAEEEWTAFTVTKEAAGVRLDRLLCGQFPEQSRTYFEHLITSEAVRVNGKVWKKREQPAAGDVVEVQFQPSPELSLSPEKVPLTIVYEDDHLVILNKAAGMVVHPAPGHWSGTLANGLLYHCQHLPGEGIRPGIVHRLDKDTSGLLIAAKDTATQERLIGMFAERDIEKEYLAICIGQPAAGTIRAPIGRHPRHRQQMAVVEEGCGKEAVTHVEPLGFCNPLSAVRLRLETGRTHQIRVHMLHTGTPILGDATYGRESLNGQYKACRQMLHAYRLTFKHPATGVLMTFSAPPPEDFLSFLHKIDPKLCVL